MIDGPNKRKIPCPGPKPYGEQDADVFFGREDKLSDILARVRAQRLSVLDAPSASGKTSLLQAGLLPAMRLSRLAEIVEPSGSLPAFPLLVNQWLGRRAAEVDYSRIVVVEVYRALKTSRQWYSDLRAGGTGDELADQAPSELAAVAAAQVSLRETAARLGLTTFDPTRDILIPVPLPESRVSDRDTVRNLVEVMRGVAKAFGSVLLIWDQFEEVLGDKFLGRQAVAAVDAIFLLRRDDMRQFISLRNDSLYLLDALERKGILETKRRVSLDPLGPESVRGIVCQMSDGAGIQWEDHLVERLVAAFTLFPGDGSAGRDVNLLGLQVVLRNLFERAFAANVDLIDLEAVRAYAAELAGNETSSGELDVWLRRSVRSEGPDSTVDLLFRENASQRWIDRCLDIPEASSRGDIEPRRMRPMVARMAEWLVTPAGFKRPMTLGELEQVAFLRDLENAANAGRAKRENWSREKREDVLRSTCTAALGQLVAGGVLKERGSDVGSTYELVHDQFGRPLKQWAVAALTGADADVSAFHEIIDHEFPWAGELRQWVPGGVLRDVGWPGCTLTNVDFRGLRVESCRFSRALFKNCRFPGSVMANCAFDQAMFDGCVFDTAKLDQCDLSSAAFVNCKIAGVTFSGGSMRSANLRGNAIQNCTFNGMDGEMLSMRNLELLDCSFVGTTEFRRCSLDGATLGADDSSPPVQASELSFSDCNLAGAELNNLDFTNGTLRIVGGQARGAVFDRLCLPRSTDSNLRGEFVDVVLTGAIFLGCELRSVRFAGHPDRPDATVEAKTLVLRESDRRPTILDDVLFVRIDLENAMFKDCHVVGPLRFQQCDLSGASLVTSQDDSARVVEGSLRFEGCNMPAIKLSLLDLVGDNRLTVVRCSLPGAFFNRIKLATSVESGEVACFDASDMPGAIFQGCCLQGVAFKGGANEQVSLKNIELRSGGESQSTMRDCKFVGLRMDNAIVNDTELEGVLSFSGCVLAGGTIGGTGQDAPMRIRGDLRFDDCDCNALEFANLRFESKAHLHMSGGTLRGGLFDRVICEGCADDPAMVVRDVELSGTVFVGCALGATRFTGGSSGRHLTPAWNLVIRGADKPGRVGSLLIEGYDCDGGALQSLLLDGPVTFRDCSLLRLKLSNLDMGRQGAFLDLRDSDLLYAEIDKLLLGNAAPAGDGSGVGVGVLRLRPRQWLAAQAAAEWQSDLRLSQRK